MSDLTLISPHTDDRLYVHRLSPKKIYIFSDKLNSLLGDCLTFNMFIVPKLRATMHKPVKLKFSCSVINGLSWWKDYK